MEVEDILMNASMKILGRVINNESTVPWSCSSRYVVLNSKDEVLVRPPAGEYFLASIWDANPAL